MIKNYLIKKGLLVSSSLFVILMGLILLFIFTEASPLFNEYGFIKFIMGLKWAPDDYNFGIFPMIVGSIYVTGISLILAIPLSISCAIFLEEMAPNNIKLLFKPIIQTLAGIPSVVYGLFGLTVLVPFIQENFNSNALGILSASIILAIMILPTIISVSQDAIRNVPDYLREASMGLGANQWQTIKNIVIPVALPGIITAIILGIGRAIGETLAVLMLVGNVAQVPNSIFDSARTLTSNIALEMNYATGMHYNALFATAGILLIVIVLLMLLSNYIQNKYAIK